MDSRICLGGRVEIDEEKRLQLDYAQMSILENLEENNRLLIRGPAGTGKTLLAREAALRESRQGKWVLFLCYTEALAAFFWYSIVGNIDILPALLYHQEP